MKKLFCFSALLFFFVPILVSASDILATYTYRFTHYSEEYSFMIHLMSDGTLEKEIEDGDFFVGSDMIHYFGTKNFDKEFLAKVYQNGKVITNIPALYYCKDDLSPFYNIYNYPTMCGDVSSAPVTGSVEILDEEQVAPSKEKVFCERTRSLRNDYNVKIKFFLDAEGNKKYSIYRIGGNQEGGEKYVDELIQVNQYLFQVSDSVKNTFYQSESACKNTPLYFKSDGVTGTSMILTTEKPNANDNGSFAPGDADRDDGSDTSKEDVPPGIPDKDLCEGDNCDISFSGLCEEPRVARTLKFFGIILFLIKIFIPFLIIVLGSVDFAKAMLDGKADDIQKKLPVFVKRIITGIVVFFIPSIINFLFSVIDSYSETMEKYDNCRVCIFEPDDCDIKD